jgi:predicted nucleic acid-binding protein
MGGGFSYIGNIVNFYIYYMEKLQKSVYIETTIPSYATAKPSIDIISANRQNITKLFWEYEKNKYKLYISQFVIEECRQGNADAAKRRLEFIKDIALISQTDTTENLANEYFNFLKISERAKTDCFHLALCVEAKIDYLLTWNCSHLGIEAYAKIYEYNNKKGLWIPKLVTPEHLIQLEREESNAV